MNKMGVHLLVWQGEINKTILDHLPAIKEMGYEGVEVPIFGLDTMNPALVRAAIEEAGLDCTAATVLPQGLALIDDFVRAKGVKWLQQVIKITAELGASVLCGPMTVPVGDLRGRGYTVAEWDSCVLALREAAQTAADYGIILALEPLNRFETFCINTVADGVRLMQAIDHPSVGLLLDTFHMNIEEPSLTTAIHQAGSYIKHFHCSENDRGIVGSGHVPWAEVFAALKMVKYEGWLMVESFSTTIPELAAATCIWRPLAPSPDALAEGSVHFMRQQWQK